jgi:S-layer homology domain
MTWLRGVAVGLFAIALLLPGSLSAASCSTPVAQYVDPTYGSTVRHIVNDVGHDHNLYYHRDPWNADGTYMVGVKSELDQTNWRVVLYDGDGCYIKDLFPINAYDWRLVWDRHDPKILYTRTGSAVYRYDVLANAATLLKKFSPLGLLPNGLSVNQAGDRILVVTSDFVFRSYRLPDMTEERTFTATFPAGCTTPWKNERYIGYANYIATGCNNSDLTVIATDIYDDTGALLHRFDGIGLGHTDFSPTGLWAYGRWAKSTFTIHVVDLAGTSDTVVFSRPLAELAYVQNWHVSWPAAVADWLVVSFFPNAAKLPPAYAPFLDEIVRVHVDGTADILARSETADSDGFFWAQPLASPSADGRRIAFNSNRSGTINQYILYVEGDLSGVFVDVPEGYWARSWIEALYFDGVTGGCTTAPLAYCPESPVTREEMAVFLLRATEGPEFAPPPCAAPPFGDNPCSSPFTAWIQELVSAGITTGCGSGNYCPAAPVTREQMAVFLLKAALGPGFVPAPCMAPPFADVPCSSPFAPWIQALVARGITAGCTADRYCPTSAVSRAQMAVFLVKTFALPL